MASEIANKIRQLTINTYAGIVVTGDKSKSSYIPLWGTVCDIPGLYISSCLVDKTEMRCQIWDIKHGEVCTNKMFFSDDINYNIIIYDIPYRNERTKQRHHNDTIFDYIQRAQTYSKNCEVVVIIVTDGSSDHKIVHKCCTAAKFNTIIMKQSNLDTIRELPTQLCTILYNARSSQLFDNVRGLLENSTSKSASASAPKSKSES